MALPLDSGHCKAFESCGKNTVRAPFIAPLFHAMSGSAGNFDEPTTAVSALIPLIAIVPR